MNVHRATIPSAVSTSSTPSGRPHRMHAAFAGIPIPMRPERMFATISGVTPGHDAKPSIASSMAVFLSLNRFDVRIHAVSPRPTGLVVDVKDPLLPNVVMPLL